MTEDFKQATDLHLSPYSVDRDENDHAELRRFLAGIMPILEPGLAEILSEETRKGQRLLLGFSFVLTLLGMAALRLSGTIKYQGLEFSLDASVLLKAMIALAAYFEVLVGIRCFTDWSAYRIKTSLAELDLKHIAYEFYSDPARPFAETKEGLRTLREQTWERLSQRPGGADGESPVPDEGVFSKREQEHISQTQLVMKKSAFFQRQVFKVRVSRRARFAWEIAFPLSFGAVALVSALRAVN